MLRIRRAQEIHAVDGGWFSARWHFSFDHYRDPENMGIGPLRVFNDDRLISGAIWPMHPHADVEGITYVVEGHFRHEDNVGGGGVLEPGAVQRMTLGSGAYHSEQNASQDEPMRFLQFWILPRAAGLTPGVEQRQYTADDFRDVLRKVLDPDGDDALTVHQDARAYVSRPSAGIELEHAFAEGRGGYLYLMDGDALLDDEKISDGDAAKIEGPHQVRIGGGEGAHLILIDVPLAYTPVGTWAR